VGNAARRSVPDTMAAVLRRDPERARDDVALWRLQRQWAAVVVASGVSLSAFAAGLSRAWGSEPARAWALGASVASAWVLGFVFRHLGENRRRSGQALLDELGLGNALTLTRGLAIAWVAGFALASAPEGALAWLPAVLYTFAAVADFFDGYLARRADHSTELGARLDLELDALGIAAATVVAIGAGRLPWWFAPLGVGRYLFIAALWWRSTTGREVFPLPESAHRRLFAGVLMGLVSVALWPIVPTQALHVVSVVVAVPLAAGFIRDGLVASGRIDAETEHYRRWQRTVVNVARVHAPPLLRVVAFASASIVLAELWSGRPGLALAGAIALAGVVLGWLGRGSALGLLVPVALHVEQTGLVWHNGAALVALVSIIVLGTGAVSRWQPEERFLFSRPGTAGFGAR